MLSQTEENYLKTLLKLTTQYEDKTEAGTNEIALLLGVKPATTTDMLKKLKEKKLVHYEKYGKIILTADGKRNAMIVVRKHRLWETFLNDTLDFAWDEVHEIAEQLEHIHSEKLINKLDEFLGYPKFDPHGDPIPKENGELPVINSFLLANAELNKITKVLAVKDTSSLFLKYLEKINISIGSLISVIEKNSYDNSILIKIDEGRESNVSFKFAQNLLVNYRDKI
jgi:DtxR family Mn-dependent transcriptional regulator